MRAIRNLLSTFLLLALSGASAQTNLDFKRTEDVIYGRKFGTALTLDVFQPQPANGVGLVFMVSGGWFSAHENINVTEMGKDLDLCGDWFDQYLRGLKPKQ